MVAYLSKSDASEGFNQIIDFLNGSSIKYTLTVNPNIYVSCIKQFWTTVAVKQVNDVTRLQALVDKKKVVVTKATIREVLHLDDEAGVECLPNEEIFAELARMGYEKPSTKLTFYKAFFSSQWKFLIHTIFQCMSAKRTSWNEFNSTMASARVGKGFFGVATPLFESMLVEQQVDEEGDADENVKEVNVGDAAKGDVTVLMEKFLLLLQNHPFHHLHHLLHHHNNFKISFQLPREDLEALWSLVKERFSITKPKNFSDDFLLVTLGVMFKKPDIHAQIWKNQRSVYCPGKVKGWKLLESCGVQIITFTTTQLILLVERKYPLTRFTLDQMLNAVRLEVEEESEVSLELLSFGVDAAMDLKKKHAKCLVLLVKDLVLPSKVDAID
uniref:Xylulose kinase-1 n=1 Tax=Tanacetum cinerariifolium TaxID=118510 RepID=A0A6L2KL68_TANCI|nr:hypothetical protein [Tanacetum cinerariifolium]